MNKKAISCICELCKEAIYAKTEHKCKEDILVSKEECQKLIPECYEHESNYPCMFIWFHKAKCKSVVECSILSQTKEWNITRIINYEKQIQRDMKNKDNKDLYRNILYLCFGYWDAIKQKFRVTRTNSDTEEGIAKWDTKYELRIFKIEDLINIPSGNKDTDTAGEVVLNFSGKGEAEIKG